MARRVSALYIRPNAEVTQHLLVVLHVTAAARRKLRDAENRAAARRRDADLSRRAILASR